MSKNNLYDFVQDTQIRNSNCQIYLIENNVEIYKKIAQLLKIKQKKQNIVKID